MTPRTFRATLDRHSQQINGCDYELPVTVEYVWHDESPGHHDATAEIVAVVDDEGHDVYLTTEEEVRLMRLAESYHENPVQTVRA